MYPYFWNDMCSGCTCATSNAIILTHTYIGTHNTYHSIHVTQKSFCLFLLTLETILPRLISNFTLLVSLWAFFPLGICVGAKYFFLVQSLLDLSSYWTCVCCIFSTGNPKRYVYNFIILIPFQKERERERAVVSICRDLCICTRFVVLVYDGSIMNHVNGTYNSFIYQNHISLCGT